MNIVIEYLNEFYKRTKKLHCFNVGDFVRNGRVVYQIVEHSIELKDTWGVRVYNLNDHKIEVLPQADSKSEFVLVLLRVHDDIITDESEDED